MFLLSFCVTLPHLGKREELEHVKAPHGVTLLPLTERVSSIHTIIRIYAQAGLPVLTYARI